MGVAQFFSDRLRHHLGYPPTPCQERLFDTLAAFAVQYDTCDLLLVSGYAGTGKTSLVSALIQTLPRLRVESLLLAPTGRAAKVIAGYSGRPAFTIHKKIYMTVMDGGGKRASAIPRTRNAADR